jgi:hypothetical protein
MTKAYIIIFLLAAASMEGCSAIGYGIGSLIDNGGSLDTTGAFNKPIFRDVHNNVGRAGRIEYPDSKTEFAIFKNYSEESDSSYTARFEKFSLDHQHVNLISLHNKLVVTDIYESRYQGVFCAYMPLGLEIENNTEKKISFGLSRIEQVNTLKTNAKFNQNQLRALYDNNDVPVRSSFEFQNSRGSFTMTNSDFRNVEFTDRGNARWWGMAIGIVVDIYCAIGISNFGKSWNYGGGWR